MINYQLSSGATVTVKYPVEKELVIGGKHILTLRKQGGGTPYDNVICFDAFGMHLWTIEGYSAVAGDNPYMNVKLDQENRLVGETWSGVHLIVDIESGKILEMIKRRPW